jgi:3',5'-cyclic AMP phosphodiesterase CpdA
MLIGHISDLHIRAPGELAYRRVDTAAHLRRCVAHILARRPLPEAVVATGDLADLGRPDEYAHLARLLAPLPMPVFLIAGNHDHRGSLRDAFPQQRYLQAPSGFLQYTARIGEVRLVALDTVVPGEGGGFLCASRLEWLEHQLADDPTTPTLILMHHPPFETGIAHMDRVGLRFAYPLEPIVRRHPNVERILCGHLHRTIFRRYGGTIAVTCPSPAHQVVLDLSSDAPSAFVMEPPGYLLHSWTETEGLVSFSAVVGDYDGPYPFFEDGKLIE